MKLTAGAEHEVNPSAAVDTDGKFMVAFEAHTPPPSLPGYPGAVGHPDPVPVIPGLNFTNGVGTTAIRQLAELGFNRQFAFEHNGKSPIGTTLNGHAQIVNRGLAGDKVLIEYMGDGSVIGQQTIFLKPGQTFDIDKPYVVQAGSHTYGVRLTPYGGDATPGGPEVFGSGDNQSSATLVGTSELLVQSVSLSVPEPSAGQNVTVTARVRNASQGAINTPFKVFLFDKEPSQTFPNKPTPVGQVDVASMAAGGFLDVTFPWTVPAAGGKQILTVRADALNTIAEVNEFNNEAYAVVMAHAQSTPSNVTAEVLNYSGKNNVRVRATITNNGKAPVTNLPVKVYWALDEGAYAEQAQKVIPLLAPGASTQLEWIVDGLAGLNRYRVAIDPAQTRADADKTDNTAETTLILQGLPDLVMGEISLDALPQQNEALKVLMTITNTGIAKAPETDVEVFAIRAGIGQFLVGKMHLEEMPALSVRTLAIPIDTTQLVGAVELIAYVDRKRNILETSDLNNSDSLRTEFLAATRVVGRHVFYNNSVLDRKTPGPSVEDDNAIDPAKSALRPGQLASAENYTLYSRGLNGIMIDFEDFVGTPSLSNFRFRVGTDSNVDKWLAPPNPTSITLREGVNRGDPDRVTIIWADGAINNQWLQVSVLPGAATGLNFADVFYFGNFVGDSTGDGEVNNDDFKVLYGNFGRTNAGPADGDYDGDGKVGFGDYQLLGQMFGKKLAMFRTPVGAGVPAQSAPTPARKLAAPKAAAAKVAAPEPVAYLPTATTPPVKQLSPIATAAKSAISVPARPQLKSRVLFSTRAIQSVLE
jgi:hypothetical protein